MQSLYKNVWHELYGEAREALVVIPRLNALQVIKHRIKKGRMEAEACAVCDDPKSEPHWVDYEEPLDVLWFCSAHHKELHKHLQLDLAY